MTITYAVFAYPAKEGEYKGTQGPLKGYGQVGSTGGAPYYPTRSGAAAMRLAREELKRGEASPKGKRLVVVSLDFG